VCRNFVPRTCNSYYLAAVLNYTKEKKRERGKGKEVLKAASKKNKEKKRNFRIALHPLSPWLSPIIFAYLN
jgi:hypothetical protein